MSSNTQTELDKALSQAGYTGGVDETVTHAPLYSRTVRSRDISKRTGRWECPLFYDAHDAGRLDPTPEDVEFATANLNDPRPAKWFQEMHDDLDAAEQDLCDSIRTTQLYGKQLLNTGTVLHFPVEQNVKYIRKQRALLDRAFQISSDLDAQLAAAIGQDDKPSELEQQLKDSIAAKREEFEALAPAPPAPTTEELREELANAPNAATWIGDGPIEVPDEVIPVAAHERKKPTERKSRSRNQTSPAEETGTITTDGLIANIEKLQKENEKLAALNAELRQSREREIAEALAPLRADYEKLENGMFAALNYINSLSELNTLLQKEVDLVDARALAVQQADSAKRDLEDSKKTWPVPKRFTDAAAEESGIAQLFANLQRLAGQ